MSRKRVYVPTTSQVDRAVEMVQADDNEGICLHCDEETFGVEPDACRYPCEVCGVKAVFGASEILLMGVA